MELRQFVRKNGGKCRPFAAVDVKLDNFNIVEPEMYDFHAPIPVHIWENRLTLTIVELERA